MMKKFLKSLSLVMALVMCFTMVFTAAVSADEATPTITFGVKDSVALIYPEISSVLINKGTENDIVFNVITDEKLVAPVVKGQSVGCVQIFANGKVIAEYDINAESDVEKLTFFSALYKLFSCF